MGKRNKIVCVMTLSLSSLCCIQPVGAQEALPQPMDSSIQEKGSVHVGLEATQDKLSKEGVGLSLAYVMMIGEGDYQFTEGYSSVNVDLNTAETVEGPQEVVDTLQPLVRDAIQMRQTNTQGIVNFIDLEVGVYLLHASDRTDYETIQLTLISVLMWDEVTRQMNYHIEIFLRHVFLSTLHMRKVDYYDHKSISKEATLTLYSDAVCTKIIKTEKIDPKSGIAVFDGLIYGTVYVKETKVPTGYQLPKEVIRIMIDDNWVNGDDNLRMIVYADRPLAMSGGPDTGDHTSVVGWITLFGVPACTAFFLLCRRHEVQWKKASI